METRDCPECGVSVVWDKQDRDNRGIERQEVCPLCGWRGLIAIFTTGTNMHEDACWLAELVLDPAEA